MKKRLLSQLQKYRCSDINKLQDILDETYLEIKTSSSDEEAKTSFLDGIQKLEYERQSYEELIPILKQIYKYS